MSNIIDDDGHVWIQVGTDKYVLLSEIRQTVGAIHTRGEIREQWGPVATVKLPWET